MKTLLIIGLLMFIVACAPAQQSTEGPIKVGHLGPLTGDAAVIGVPGSKAVQLAVDQKNAAGGIDGRQIELIMEDARCDAGAAAQGATKLVNQDKVRGIVGALCSTATLSAAPIAEAGKTVLISPGSSNPDITNAGEYIFRVFPSDSLQGVVVADLATRLGYETVAVVHVNNDYGAGLAGVFAESFTANGGEVVLTEAYEQSETNFRTILTKVKAEDPDMVFAVALPAEAGILLRQKGELAVEQQFIMSEAANDGSVLEAAGDAAEGVYVTFPKAPDGIPAYELFVADYKAAYGEDAGSFTAEAYDAMNILLWAIETGGNAESLSSVLSGMGQYAGASGSFAFDANGDVEKPYTVLVVENGAFVAHDELMS